MLKKLLWSILGIIIIVPIVAALGGIKLFQFKAMGASAAAMVTPPEVVTAIDVKADVWQPRISSVGSVMSVQGTVVSTEAEGVVREIKFAPGSEVKAGDVLLQLDVDIEMAQFREAEAAAELTRVSFTRAKELVESRSIAQAEFDTAAAAFKQAIAKVENLRAVIAKKTVRAPFSGRLGIREVSEGAFLSKGSPVVTLQSLDPVYVDFSLPQQRLGEVSEGLKVEVKTDAYLDQKFFGEITAINPDIDAATRSVRVQATLPNPDKKLRPGMFAAVDVILAKTNNVLIIPETAVQHAPYGDTVFVIEENTSATASAQSTTGTATAADATTSPLVVRQQFVRLGDRRGDFVVATEGLKAGEQVVSTGVFKLRPGQGVTIDNKLAPEFKLDPTPDNT